MYSISWGDFSKQDKDGNQIADVDRLAQVLQKLLKRIEDSEKRLKTVENDILDLERN